MPSLFSRSKNKGSQASVSAPLGVYERSAPGPPPYPQAPSTQFLPDNHQPTYTSSVRTPTFPPDTDATVGHPPYTNLQRSLDGSNDPPASASPITAHESPNIDTEPKRSLRERLGLTAGLSRENLQEPTDEQNSVTKLRRKASARRKEQTYPQYSPQSPPTSASGNSTPQIGRRRPLDIPEEKESETEGLRDLASFLRSTGPSEPRRRPISLVGDPSTAQAHWNKVNNNQNQNQGAGDPPKPGSRPRSGSLGDNLERGPNPRSAHSPDTTFSRPSQAHPNPLQSSPTQQTASTYPQYQAYHPGQEPESRHARALPPLQTQNAQTQAQKDPLHLTQLSPLRQNPVDQARLTQSPYSTESPPHFEVQGPDQQPHQDSIEHGIVSELSGHLVSQRVDQPVLGSAPRQLTSPSQHTSPDMPSNSGNLQLPPRRGSVQDGSEPPTPNAVPQSRAQQQQQQQQPPQQQQQAANVNIQRAQTTTETATGRSTPPPQVTAKDMSEEDVNTLIRDYKELREKYSKVKRYYFDKEAQVTTLQNALAHQKLSQSRTSLDDGEYMQRLQRLDGLISQLAFGFRKDWKTLPQWIQPFVNKDAITVGKQEMTAVGRAFISRWLIEEVFNKYFHPGLDIEVSKELKAIQNNIRGHGTALQTGEEEDALTSKIINWRLATTDGLGPVLNAPESTDRRNNLIELLDAQLVSSLTEHMTETPAGLEGGVHMITELAVMILMHLPYESRDVVIEWFSPLSLFDERVMKAESGIPTLTAPMAPMESIESDRLSINSDRSDYEDDEDTGKMEKQEPRRGFLRNLMDGKKPPPQGGKAGAASQNSLLQPPGSAGGPKEERVRLCVCLSLAIRGKMVLSQAPVYKIP